MLCKSQSILLLNVAFREVSHSFIKLELKLLYFKFKLCIPKADELADLCQLLTEITSLLNSIKFCNSNEIQLS